MLARVICNWQPAFSSMSFAPQNHSKPLSNSNFKVSAKATCLLVTELNQTYAKTVRDRLDLKRGRTSSAVDGWTDGCTSALPFVSGGSVRHLAKSKVRLLYIEFCYFSNFQAVYCFLSSSAGQNSKGESLRKRNPEKVHESCPAPW